MKTSHWDAHDRAEHEALLREAWDSSPRQPERNARFLDGLRDAEQAHRGWARECLERAVLDGCARQLKAFHQRDKLAVSLDGRILSKPRMAGTRTRTPDGEVYQTQALFDYFTVEQIRDKRHEYLSQAQTYSDSAALCDKLLALCEKAGADTPAGAAARLGTTVAAWLARGAAA